MFPYPCHFIKILVTSRGTDGLAVYVLKGTKFNFLLHLKYPRACKIVIFFYWEKITPLRNYMCYNKKLYHTVKLYRTHNNLLPVPDR
jgi:hypothetical protein